jgi:SMODS-associating 2TM, beta-strand rich effector domain
MLHLLPIRFVLQALATATAVIIFAAFYYGWIGPANGEHSAFLMIRWSSGIVVVCVAVLHLLWRWLPPVGRWIFPYLGGSWSGTIQFQNDNGQGMRDVVLEIKHTLFALKLLLESNESISWTLAVHAERSPDFERYRMYYVYLNERKEGTLGGGERYRGLAVLRFVPGTNPELRGDYFTDTHRRGTLQLRLEKPTPWWRLWR